MPNFFKKNFENSKTSSGENLGDEKIERFPPGCWRKIKKDILAIENSAFEHGVSYDDEELEETFNKKVSFNYIVKNSKNKIIGYLISSPLDSYEDCFEERNEFGNGKTIYMESIAILPECQGRGLGKKLMFKFLEEVSKEYDRVTMHSSHETMHKMTKNLGFVQLKKIKKYTGGRDAYYVEKKFKKD